MNKVQDVNDLTKPYSIEFLIFYFILSFDFSLSSILLISIILSIYPSAPVISVFKHLPKVIFWVHSIEKSALVR